MALYANYVSNPSFELNTTGWSSFSSGQLTRVGSNASAGSYSLRIRSDADRDVWRGVSSTVDITPASGQPYTLSLNVSGATEEHGSSYSGGTRVTVFDLLPGQNIGDRNQLAQQTFSRSTNGRVAVRNFTPRASADRIVITIETSSTYYVEGGVVYEGPYERTGFETQFEAELFADSKWNSKVYHYTIQGGIDRWRVVYYERVNKPTVSGGLATVFVDGVKIEQGTIETAYVDGSTPGYLWSGAPHASPTLNAALLEASGSLTLSGSPVDLLLLRFMQATGELFLTGEIDIKTEGTVSGDGAVSLDGDAEIWQYGPVSAEGELGLSGEAVLYTFLDLSASGEMGPGEGPDAPSVEMFKTWPTGSDGEPMILSGAIEMTFPQPISASGDLTLSGDARADIGWPLIASGELLLSGVASLDEGIPQGAFRDFAIYSVNTADSDPLKFGVGPSNAGTESGAQNQPWTRIYAEFYAPADQPHSNGYLWRRAAYAAVGFTFEDVAAGNYQELACVQLEPSSANDGPGPRSYRTAKTIRPLVWADKINYSRGIWWTFFGTTDITVTELAEESPIPNDPFPIHEITFESDEATGFAGDNIINPLPDSRCVTSVYVKGDGNVPTIQVRVLNGALVELGVSGQVPLPADEWVRISVPFITDASDQIVSIQPPPTALAYPASIQVAGLQTELGTQASEYMHFVAGTQDYYYRNNGVDKTLGVFLYRNREERLPLLTGALEEHAPLSVRVSEPEFGLNPYLDA